MFERMPHVVRMLVVQMLPTTRDRLNVALTCHEMFQAVKESNCLAKFNASELISKDVVDMYGYYTLIKKLGAQVLRLKVYKNSMFMIMLQAQIPDFAEYMPNLFEVYIRRSGNVPFLHFLKELGRLQKLTLEMVGAPAVEFRKAICAMGQQLHQLSVAHNRQLTVRDVIYLVKQCPNLETLDVTGTEPLPSSAVHAILLLCPRLRTFLFTPDNRHDEAADWIDAVQGKYNAVTVHCRLHSKVFDHKKHLKELKHVVEVDVDSDSEYE